MIRINLLPYREKAKKENVRRQVSILGGVLVLFVLILLAVHLYFTMSVSRLEAEVKAADAKLVALNKKVGDVEGLKREKKELEQKLGVIKTLEETGSSTSVCWTGWVGLSRKGTCGWKKSRSPRTVGSFASRGWPGTASRWRVS